MGDGRSCRETVRAIQREAKIDPTAAAEFAEGWVTFTNFRGTRRRIRIGDGPGEAHHLGRISTNVSSGPDRIYLADSRNVAVISWVSPLFVGSEFESAAGRHGILIDKSLHRSSLKAPKRWWLRRMGRLRPHLGYYLLHSGLIIFVLVACLLGTKSKAAWWLVPLVPVLATLKWAIDKWRFARYVAKHPIPETR